MASAYETAKTKVEADKSDFNAWGKLLGLVEKQDIEVIRTTFDEFLGLFPFTYGYWQKYAAAELRVGDAEDASDEAKEAATAAAKAVYERAAAAVPFSADMWLNYTRFAVANLKDEADGVFERALESCTYDPRVADVWRELIKFKTTEDDKTEALKVLSRALAVSMPYASQFMDEYKKVAGSAPLEQLATAEERAEVQASIADFAEKSGEEQEKATREAIIAAQKAKFDATSPERAARVPLETPLAARWYFHVTPVDGAQKATWRKYCAWAEKQDDVQKASSIFQRCVIVCANTSEFWIRFAKFLSSKDDTSGAVTVLQRAVKLLGSKDPRPAILLAAQLERAGRGDEAREVYQKLQSATDKPVLEAVLNHCNFERRSGNLATAVSVLQRALAQSSGAAAAYIAVRIAELENKSSGAKAARAAFSSSVEKVGASLSFWQAWVSFETRASVGDDEEGVDADAATRVAALVRTALGVTEKPLKEGEEAPPATKLKPAEQLVLWQRLQMYVENNGTSVEQVDGIKAEIARWELGAGASLAASASANGSTGAKRSRPDGLPGQQASKKPRTGGGVYGSGYYGGAGYGAGAGSAYGYGSGGYGGYRQ